MRKPSKRTQRVISFLQKNPSVKPAVVAKTFKMAVQYVYKLRNDIKRDKELTMSKSPAILFKSSSKRETKPKTKTFYSMSATQLKEVKKLVTEDNVNHPSHYKTGGIETIDFIEAKSLNYNLGNVVKYITRADHKGRKLEDLKKAQWYLNREVSNLEK